MSVVDYQINIKLVWSNKYFGSFLNYISNKGDQNDNIAKTQTNNLIHNLLWYTTLNYFCKEVFITTVLQHICQVKEFFHDFSTWTIFKQLVQVNKQIKPPLQEENICYQFHRRQII